MTDTSHKRFMFEKSFDLSALKAAEEEKAAPTYGEQELSAAREQAYGQGFVAGKEAAMRELQSQQNHLLSNIQGLFERIAEEVWKSYAQRKQAASDIALAIALKLVPDYVRKNGVQEILVAIEGCVAEMINEPRLVLRVSDPHFDIISSEVSAMTARLGYGGKMIILADNALSEFDCRIEWADGGMEKSINLTWSDIEKQLARHHVTSHPPHHPTHEAPSEHGTSTNIAV